MCKQIFEEKRDEQAVVVDMATALSAAFDRFNFSRAYGRLVLVLLTDGLQRTEKLDWRGGVPSDSWCVHPDSPFSPINPNINEAAELQVVILPTLESYADMSHADLIKRWYALFFHLKKARLVAFTFDHRAAKNLLLSGRDVKAPPPPEPTELESPLGFTPVEALSMK